MPERGQHRRGRAPAARPPRRRASRSIDQHRDFGVLAVQGPRSADVLDRLGLPADQDYMAYADADWDGRPVRICRTGYTGEHGYELIPRWADSAALWDALVEVVRELGGMPAGLGARDTLRTEMGYPLHGQDLSLEITPVQARSGWAVGWKKDAFWGRDALLAERQHGPARLLRGLESLDRGIPRAHMAVLAADGDDGRRGHQRDVLTDAAGRHRPGADRHRRRRRGRRRGGDRRARPAQRGAGGQAAVRASRTCAEAQSSFAGPRRSRLVVGLLFLGRRLVASTASPPARSGAAPGSRRRRRQLRTGAQRVDRRVQERDERDGEQRADDAGERACRSAPTARSRAGAPRRCGS